MNDSLKNISDELVTRYISGVATPQEESELLQYMEQHPDFADDLLAITAAIKAQHDSEAANKTIKTTRRISFRPIYSIAAAVAALVAVVLVLRISQPSSSAPVVATTDADTVETDVSVVVSDTQTSAVVMPTTAPSNNKNTRLAEGGPKQQAVADTMASHSGGMTLNRATSRTASSSSASIDSVR